MKSLKLRAPEPDDANLIYIWENSSDERHSTLRTGPVSRLMINRFIENYDGEIYSQGALRFMIDVENQTVGTVDVYDYEPRGRHAFVGIYVSPAYRRKGIATMALREVEKLMHKNVSLTSLVALVSADNEHSILLFEKHGYRRVGVLKSWLNDGERQIDALLYQKSLP